VLPFLTSNGSTEAVDGVIKRENIPTRSLTGPKNHPVYGATVEQNKINYNDRRSIREAA